MCREKSARVAVVSQPAAANGADSSDEENQEGEDEQPEIDDSEILEDLPDDAEVAYPFHYDMRGCSRLILDRK